MIKKLRIRLIAASMAALFLVLAVVMGSITYMNYRRVTSDADRTLSILVSNNGDFPAEMRLRPGFPGRNAGPADDSGREEPVPGEPEESPELAFESRYFSVVIDGDGDVVSCDTEEIAAVDTDTAIEYARTVLSSGKTSGYREQYRYMTGDTAEGTLIVFLDCQRDLRTVRNFLFTGIGVSLLGMAAVLLLLILFSGRIVKPVSDSYEKQKRFITDAGHELKTPLTVINADAEIIGMDTGENEWLEDIKNQTDRLASLTNDLIYLSRMEEESNKLQMIDMPLSDIVEETAKSFSALALTQEKTFECDIMPMITMHGDDNSIRQLVSILLDNALKYSEKGGTIRLILDRHSRTIRLSVYNTAEYVSRDELPHLFDRFYRADESRNSQTGGHGLGLSIASAIVSSHKGKISASTEDERSLTVTVQFPGQAV